MALLRTDYFDVVHMHDPEDLMPVLEPGGALEALKELKEQGMMRGVGVGARSHGFHRHCLEAGEFDVSLTYPPAEIEADVAAV